MIVVFTAAYTAGQFNAGGTTTGELFLVDTTVPIPDSVRIGGEHAESLEDAQPTFSAEFERFERNVTAQIFLDAETIALSALVPDSFSILTEWTGRIVPASPFELAWGEATNRDRFTLRVITYSGVDQEFQIHLDTTVTVNDTLFIFPAAWLIEGYSLIFQISADNGSVYQYGHSTNVHGETFSAFVGGRFYYPPISAEITER